MICHLFSQLTLIWYNQPLAWNNQYWWHTLTLWDYESSAIICDFIDVIQNTVLIFSISSASSIHLLGPNLLEAIIDILFHTHNLALVWRTIAGRHDTSAALINALHYIFYLEWHRESHYYVNMYYLLSASSLWIHQSSRSMSLSWHLCSNS